MKRKILIGLGVLFVLIQFIRIDTVNPPVVAEEDFFAIQKAPEEVENLIKTACYDCHSHTSEYPWYSNIAPVSWWLRDHINEGRSHLNFSTWASLNEEKSAHKLEECAEMLEATEMPLLSYMIAHRDAWINAEQRATLVAYFQSLQ
jgi:hypothetical protein